MALERCGPLLPQQSMIKARSIQLLHVKCTLRGCMNPGVSITAVSSPVLLCRGTTEAAKAQRELREEIGETAAAQAELDAAAAGFRALHAERQALTARWDEALAVLARHAEPVVQG